MFEPSFQMAMLRAAEYSCFDAGIDERSNDSVSPSWFIFGTQSASAAAMSNWDPVVRIVV